MSASDENDRPGTPKEPEGQSNRHPQTPPGFQIRTPSDESLFRLIFGSLPILRFQETMRFFRESVKAFDPSLTTLAPLLGKSYNSNNLDQILPIIDSLLPNSALLDEATASGLAVERVDKLDTVQFLNLATFLISKNFPGRADGGKIYKWLKDHGTNGVFNVLSSAEGPTAKALLENLFRLAVEAEDLPTVKYLLKAGVNPNGSTCRDKQIPDTLTPLQFACIAGNSELAQELIKAGSTIDQPGSGWKNSILVLAIIGGQEGR
ncbi:uncharacterized protein PAC_19641 [Phialocephala subalpina]|uniref:Uncharacterized protein n=1 Tax=Phialocephala subalpina TaxID=576137 RepID=A0A1L7XXE7_9HELO|nr:uncharacterized protein PAC_19641 [Phialocephala subalpina]